MIDEKDIAARGQSDDSPQVPVNLDGDGIPRWLRSAGRQERLQTAFVGLWQPAAIVLGGLTAGLFWCARSYSLAYSVLGIAGLAVGLKLGLLIIRLGLRSNHPLVAVARAVVEEAVSTKLSVLFLVLLLLTLPTLPLLLDPAERLSYRVQFFIAWSLGSAGVLLSLLTIAIACRSVADDINTNRIHTVFSKPIQRWEYLVGKWVGIGVLNSLLVVLVGVVVYAFTLALSHSPALDAYDRLAVDEQVLTARAVALPVHPRGAEFEQSINATIEEIRKDDPVTFAMDPGGARKRIFSQRIHEWHTVTADAFTSFLFEDLKKVREKAPVLQLQLKPWADNSGISEAEVRFAIWLNDRPYPVRNGLHEEYVVRQGTVQTLDIPSSVIDEDGGLKVTVANKNLVMAGEEFPTSITFAPDEGMRILYRVGSFEGNFFRGLIVVWLKLVMLAAAATAASTWLSFPIAFLLSMMIYFSATASGFLSDAVDIYTGFDRKTATYTSMFRLRYRLLSERIADFEWWSAMKTVGAYFGDAFLAIMPSFSQYDSVHELATGRVVPSTELIMGSFQLALFYPATFLLIGCLLLSRRDLIRSSL